MIKVGYSGIRNKPYRVEQGGTITLSNGDKMYIETGYVFDNGSIPGVFKFLHDTFKIDLFHYKSIAFLVHDYLYNYRGYRLDESPLLKPVTRSFADREMVFHMMNDYELKKTMIFYYAVRLFGWRYFGKI